MAQRLARVRIPRLSGSIRKFLENLRAVFAPFLLGNGLLLAAFDADRAIELWIIGSWGEDGG